MNKGLSNLGLDFAQGRSPGFPRLRAGIRKCLLFVLLALAVADSAIAAEPREEPNLDLPIRCQLGRDCWLVNLVDLDQGPGMRDFACGRHAYDGHKGTDIAVRDMQTVRSGVDVLAAAAGVVIAVRDGMDDVDVNEAGKDSIKGRECGNGIVIDHGGAWETQYCHMRKGSVAVKKGDTVVAGARLGLVGHSGDAEFPHVHLSVRHAGRVIDPFIGTSRQDACGLGTKPLWRQEALTQLLRPMTALFNAGFHDRSPDAKSARDGLLAAASLPRDTEALVLWADMYWPEAGDVLSFRIVGPDGKAVFEKSIKIEKNQARRFVFAGRKRLGQAWPAGRYQGEVTLRRGEERTATVLSAATAVVELR
jgi:hypothetical protein